MRQEAGRLVGEVTYELSGTPQGWQASPRAQALASAAEQADDLAGRVPPRSPPFQAAARAVDAALRGLQMSLANPPGTAPASSRTVARVARLSDDLLRLAGTTGDPFPSIPGGNPGILPVPSPWGPARQAAADSLSALNQAQLYLGGTGLNRYPPYDVIGRDLAALGASLGEVVSLLDRQVGPGPILAEVQGAQARAGRLNAVLGTDPNVPPALRASWAQAVNGINRLAALLAGTPDPGPLPTPPPVIPYPPVQPIPPVLPQPPAYDPRVVLVDQALGILDQFLAVLGPTVNAVPQGFLIQRDARTARGDLLRLRQVLASGDPPVVVQGASRQVDLSYRRLAERVAMVAKGRYGANIDRVRQVGDLLAQLRAQMPY